MQNKFNLNDPRHLALTTPEQRQRAAIHQYLEGRLKLNPTERFQFARDFPQNQRENLRHAIQSNPEMLRRGYETPAEFNSAGEETKPAGWRPYSTIELGAIAELLDIKDYSELLPNYAPFPDKPHLPVPVSVEQAVRQLVLNSDLHHSALETMVRGLTSLIGDPEAEEPLHPRNWSPALQTLARLGKDVVHGSIARIPGMGRIMDKPKTGTLDAMIDVLKWNWNWSNPLVRAGLGERIMKDPAGFMGDISLFMSLGAAAPYTASRLAAWGTRRLGKIEKMPAAAVKALNAMQKPIDDAMGYTKNINDFVNNSMYTIPSDLPLIGGARFPGAAVMIDPSGLSVDLTLETLGQAIGIPFTKKRAKEVSRIYDPEAAQLLKKVGIDPRKFYASAQTRQVFLPQEMRSQMVQAGVDPDAWIDAIEYGNTDTHTAMRKKLSDAGVNPNPIERQTGIPIGTGSVRIEESQRFKAGERAEFYRFYNAANNLDDALEQLANSIERGRPLDEQLDAYITATENFNRSATASINALYKQIKPREDVVVDLWNVREAIAKLDEEAKVNIGGHGAPRLSAPLARTMETVRRHLPEGEPPTDLGTPPETISPLETPRDVADRPDVHLHIAQGSPKRTISPPTDPNTKYSVTAKVVERASLIPSHQSANPGAARSTNYDAAMQPKEMTQASHAKITGMGQNLNYEILIDPSKQLGIGPMKVKANGEIAAGNHRYWAIDYAINNNPDAYAAYKAYLQIIGPMEYGITLDTINQFDEPVLVYELDQGVDARTVAYQSAQGTSGTMSASQQARQDAHHMNDDALGLFKSDVEGNLEDVIQDGANDEFRNHVLRKFDLSEIRKWETRDTEGNIILNNDGITAFANMLLSRTLDGPNGQRLMQLFTEIDQPGMLNIRRGVYGAPNLINFEMLVRSGQIEPEYGLAEHLAEAIRKYDYIRRDGKTVEQALSQLEFNLIEDISDEAKSLLPLMPTATKTPSKLSEFINDYINDTRNQSATDSPLLAMTAESPPLPPKALIAKLVDKHAGKGDINATFDELQQAIAPEQAPDGASAGDMSLEGILTDYTYANAEKARTLMRELRDQDDILPSERRMYAILHDAIDADMIDALEENLPELAAPVRAAYKAVWEIATIRESRLASAITRRLGRVYVQDVDDTVIDDADSMVRLFIHPTASVNEVLQKKQLLTGYGKTSSPAWKTYQRSFMDMLLRRAWMPIGQTEMRRRAETGQAKPDLSTERHNPRGISDAMVKSTLAPGGYSPDVIAAVLEPEQFKALQNVNELFLRMHQLFKNTNNSQTQFGQRDTLRQLLSKDHIASILMASGGMLYGTVQENLLVAGGGALVYGGYHAIRSIFGKKAAEMYLDDFDKFGDFTQASVYEVFREHFAWRAYDIFKQAGVTGARLNRLEEQGERVMRLRDQFAPPKQ